MTFSARQLGVDRFSGLYLWAVIIVVFCIWVPDSFATTNTVHSLAAQKAVVAILALGLLVPMVAGSFDVSIGATINLSVVIVSVLQSNHQWSMWPAIGVAVGCCFAIGVVNGFIVVKLGVNSFIATLGTASVITAFQAITSGQSQPFPPTGQGWANLSRQEVFGFQIVVVYMLVFAALVWWFLEYTPGGRYLHAIGGNAEAARLSGVRVDMWTWISLTFSATVAGVAGVLYASQNGPSLTFGPSLLLPSFAAVFLGSTQLRAGRFNAWGTVLAIFVLATGVQGLQLVTGVQWLNDMFNGVALVAAVSFAIWGGKRNQTAKRAKAAAAAAAPPDDSAGSDSAGSGSGGSDSGGSDSGGSDSADSAAAPRPVAAT